MKFYISASRSKRVAFSRSSSRRFWRRRSTVVALVGLLLAFLLVGVAFLVLHSPTFSDCTGWRFFNESDISLKLGHELTKALLEAENGTSNEEGSLKSFKDLVTEMTSNRQGLEAFAFKANKILLQMERQVQLAKLQKSTYWHLASQGVPWSLHCFCKKLAEEYAGNAVYRARLPSPEHVFRLSDNSFHHVVLLTDNGIAASVVLSSTIQHSVNPEMLVFHIITDKKTHPAMHAWFATHSIKPAVVEVKGLHQFYWSEEVNAGVREMMEIHRLTWDRHRKNLDDTDKERRRYLEALLPSFPSLMNHLRIYIPELFLDLEKILFLDDDIIVQRDISSLFELDLNGKIAGAVMDSYCGENCCPGRKYKDYLNFSHQIISSNFDNEQCAWLPGMNVFDLEAWRRSNLTSSYHHWLKLNLNTGFELWHPGALPPALMAFQGQVHPMEPSWHVAGIGHPRHGVPEQVLHSAAVLHFSGPAKPWFAIACAEGRRAWNRYVNSSNVFIRECGVSTEEGGQSFGPEDYRRDRELNFHVHRIEIE